MSSCVQYPVFLLSSHISVSSLPAGGVTELAGKFHIGKPQYGLCKLGSGETGGLRIAMISWVSADRLLGLSSCKHEPIIAYIPAQITEKQIYMLCTYTRKHSQTHLVTAKSFTSSKIMGLTS